MVSQLKNGKKVVGLKQTKKAVSAQRVKTVFVAYDADPNLITPIVALCEQYGIPVEDSAGMKELGACCEIAVGASAVALLKE